MSLDDADGPAASRRGIGEPAQLCDKLYPREAYVCYCLAEHGRMALSDLADEVAVWESGLALPDLQPSEVRTAYLSLVHTHLPRLVRFGYVRYAGEVDLAWLTDEARRLEFEEPERPAEPIRASVTER